MKIRRGGELDKSFRPANSPKSSKITENRRKINGKSMKIDENPEGRRAGQVISTRARKISGKSVKINENPEGRRAGRAIPTCEQLTEIMPPDKEKSTKKEGKSMENR